MNRGNEKGSRRELWKRAWDFLFTSAGWTIGLGNVWRFPYLCYKYGGGVFLIPYLIFAIFFTFPLIILETSLGQYEGNGLINTWNVVPIMKGIGYASIVRAILGKICYMSLMVWLTKYIVASFSHDLPWANCNNVWNDENCRAYVAKFQNTTDLKNTSNNITTSGRLESAAEQYWKYEVLGISSGIEELGNLRLDLVLYTVVLWTLVYFTVFKGIKYSAKVAYVTATLPAVLIIVILIRGISLEGASDGLWFYLYPDFSKLKNFEVWTTAAAQTLYTCGAGSGILMALRCHNNNHDNFYRDCQMIVLFNMATSFFSGLAVFSALGFMAHHLNTTVDLVAESGPGLVFIVYPQSLSLLPLPQLWCVLFFLMLLLLGFDTQFASFEVVVDTFFELYPILRSHRFSKEILTAVFCILFSVLALIMDTDGGVYVFELFNTYAYGWNLFITAVCQFVAIGWLYGADRHWEKIREMIGKCRTEPVISFIWKYFGPVVGLALTVYKISIYKPLTYGSYVYPSWAEVIGHMISLSSFLCIPGYAIYLVVSSKGPISKLMGKREKDEEENENIHLGANSLL